MTKKEIEHLFTYHTPTPDSIEKLKQVREAAKQLAYVMDCAPDCADKTAAYRKLREAVMTINAAIVLWQEP